MTRAARRMPRYTSYLRKTHRSFFKTCIGYDWEVTDETTGQIVRHGWCQGTKRDALAETRLAIAELSK